ncbi:MAG: hypothetical protein AB7E31_13230 [Desulfitobacterium sp.]
MSTNEKPPRIFICEEWVYPINNNADRIQSAIDAITDDNKDMNYLFAFSLFESALSEALRQYLFAFPEKLAKSDDRKFDVSHIYNNLYNPRKLWLEIVNDEIKKQSRGSAQSQLDDVIQRFSVSFPFDREYLQAISGLRNLIAHENSLSEQHYVYGGYRPDYRKSNVSDTNDYKAKMLYLKTILVELVETLREKYGKYTAVKFVEEFWNYIFGTPVLPFSRAVITYEQKLGTNVTVTCRPNFEYIDGIYQTLSSTEKFYLSMILLQYSGNVVDRYYKFGDLPTLIGRDKSVFVWFLQVLDVFPYLFQPQ